MPDRHFLCRDYLHILFYIKFLVFVSLIHQIRIDIWFFTLGAESAIMLLSITLPFCTR